MFDKIFGEKDPIEKLQDMNEDELASHSMEIEFELKNLDRKLDKKEQEIRDLVKKGVGASRRKKMRLAAKANARSHEIDQYQQGYLSQIALFNVTLMMKAMKESSSAVNEEALDAFRNLMNVDSTRELQKMIGQINVENQKVQQQLEQMQHQVQDAADSMHLSGFGENEFVEAMDELEHLEEAEQDKVIEERFLAPEEEGAELEDFDV